MVKQRVLTASPFERIDVPIHRADQITPFPDEQCRAIRLFLLDIPRRPRAWMVGKGDKGR